MRTITTNIYVVRISNGRNKIYNNRFELAQNGFQFNHRGYNHSFYEKKMNSKEMKNWKQWAKKRKLRIDIIPEQYTRSTDYRKQFFLTHKIFVNDCYRCAYCGKKIHKSNITVDHVIPINKLSYSKITRLFARLFGISNANDIRNLVPACKSCNSSKGTKMGKWIVKGFFGRFEAFWGFVFGVRWSLGIYIGTFAVSGILCCIN